MKEKLVLTVGNGMMGDDGAGVLLARLLQESPLENWAVLNGGSTPENILHLVRDCAPQRVLVIDAADMSLPPGTIRIIPDEQLENPFFLTTHTLPLTFLIESLREFVPEVIFLGIQPEIVAFGYPMSPAVKQAVESLFEDLCNDHENWLVYTGLELENNQRERE